MIVSFLLRTLSSPTFFFYPCQFPIISSDSYLHRSVLSCQLRSSSYSLLPSCSFLFCDDASLQLGQALLGPWMTSSSYINHRTSCISLNFDLLNTPSNIPRSLLHISGPLLVFVVLLSRRFLEPLEPPASTLMPEPSLEDPLSDLLINQVYACTYPDQA